MKKRLLIAFAAVVMLYTAACFVRYYRLPPEVQAQTNTFCAANLACNITGALTTQTLGPLKFANATTAGSDCVAKLNTQDAALGATAGEIDIDSTCGTTWASTLTESGPRIYRFLGNGSYSIPLGTLVFTQPTLFEGSSHGHTVLNFTGVSGIALALNWATVSTGSYQDWSMGVRNFQIFGPGGIAGNASSAGTGISIGTGAKSPIGVLIENNLIGGFTTGATWVVNGNTWGATLRNNNFINNTTEMLINNPVESIVLDRNIFGRTDIYQTCAVNITGNVVNLQMERNEFDAGQICQTTGTVSDIEGHHENVSVATTNPFVLITGGTYDCAHCQFLQTQNSVTLPTSFISNTGGRVTFKGGGFFNSSTTAMATAVFLDTTGEYRQLGLTAASGTSTGGAFTNGVVSNAATWTGGAEYDNSGVSVGGPNFVLSASGTSSPFFRFSRGSTSPSLWDLRVTDNLGSNSLEIVNGATTILQAQPGGTSRFPNTVQPQGGLGVPLANNTALQIFNTTTSCTTAATAFVTCTTANITLPVAEADTSYRLSCTPHGPTNFPVLVGTTIVSATQFTITIEATTAAAATFASYDCIVGHN